MNDRETSSGPRRGWHWRRHLLRAAVALAAACALLLLAVTVCWHLFPFPLERLGRFPVSPLITARDGTPLLRLVAADDQWSFPVASDRISPWLAQATIAVEDERFRSHPGVDAIAVCRAVLQNTSSFRTVSGASTLTMQLCRMMQPRPRTLSSKCVESFRALQLERQWDKERILTAYLNVAPYGGNLRGAEAASWAYFGKRAADLSLSEAATLAGIPQSPTRLRPDRHPDAARKRRDTVLRRMVECGFITGQQRDLAAGEPVYAPARASESIAPHAAWMALRRWSSGDRPSPDDPIGTAETRTTIDPSIQIELERLIAEHRITLPADSEVAAVIIDIDTAEIVALVGSGDPHHPRRGQVNGTVARRSPGSALKPFVYGAAFDAGRLAPESIVHDLPIERAGWSPDNIDEQFHGHMTAAEALRRSLNVPAILVAEGVGVQRCLGTITAAGVDLPGDTASRGGLSVVVGTVEVRLLDLVNAYATLGRGGLCREPRLLMDETSASRRALSADVCAALDDILSSRHRRPAGMELLPGRQVPWFMWKTGTSSGRRDAVAVGHNHNYAIGVWIGRFEGGGDAAFSGAGLAEPLLAQLFALPALRNDIDPPAPPAIVVTRPLPPPVERGERLCIVAPSDGAVFRALDGEAIVHPRTNHAGTLHWFLNGALLPGTNAQRLTLPPGGYELRCVDGGGVASAVSFSVR